MALANCGHFEWPPSLASSAPSFGTSVIDAADEVAYSVFTVLKGGTATRIHAHTRTVTTGANVDFRLETVDATTGYPTGTLLSTNTNNVVTIGNGDDNLWIRSGAMGGTVAITAGDVVAVVLANPSSSFGNMQWARMSASAGPGWGHAGGPLRSNKNDQQQMVCAIEYDDGTFEVPHNTIPSDLITTIGLTTATNPDEVAMYFTPQFKCRVVGWWVYATLAAGADFRVNLYADGNDTPLLTANHDGEYTSTNASQRYVTGAFSSTATLSAGTTYRLGFLPTTANNVTIAYWEVPSSYLNLLDTQPGRQAMHYSSRNRSSTTDPDAAAWSQLTDRRLFGGLVLDQLDDGAGAGGATPYVIGS